MASRTLEETQENTCVVCFKGVDIYSIGQCDHPVCYECSTRMRVLCRQNECPICRQDLPKVIFTQSIKPFNSLQNINGLMDKKFQVVFETEDEKKAYEKLLAHECPKCYKVFMTFTYLRDHVRRVHQLNYCDLCVDNLKIYSRERRCYNRTELGRHRKDGDPDDRSHRGHPLCEFCDTRYMDNDELYRHLRRDHLYCHFCDADGLHQYYSSYDFLRDHFRSEHYLCEEGDCINEKFTAVFRSEIDMKAHRTTVHGRGLGKAGLKQARTLELEFTLAPRLRPTHGNRPSRYREDEFVEPAGASGGGPVEEEGSSKKPLMVGAAPELRREEDFPALGQESGGAASLSVRLTSAKQPSVSIHTSIQVNHSGFPKKTTPKNTYHHHFPALGNSGDAAVSSVSWSACSGPPKRQGGEYRAPPGLPPPEDFPSLSGRTSTGVGPDHSDSRPHPPAHRTKSSRQPAPAPLLPPPENFPSLTGRTSTGVGTEPVDLPSSTDTLKHKFKPSPEPASAQVSKTKKKKSKSGKSGGGENTPANPTVSSFLTSSGESKSKKNKKEGKSVQNTPKQEPSNQVNNNIEKVEKVNHNNNVESIIKAMSIISEKQKNNDNEEATSCVRKEKSGGDDFPSLGAPPGFSGVTPHHMMPPPPEAAPRWEIKKPPKPPPGLGKPPPGLPPPGFSGLNGGFPPLIGGLGDGSDSSNTGYITPNNFPKRNSALVKSINSSLVGETLDEFKQISVAFRNGSLAAPEYYAHCRDMLGPANFKELFPELLALLPDIEKQQDLWRTYRLDKTFSVGLSSGGSKKKASGPKVEECMTCGQILRTSDLRDHLARHVPYSQSSTAAHQPINPWAKLGF